MTRAAQLTSLRSKPKKKKKTRALLVGLRENDEMTKWQVSHGQRHGLPKAVFVWPSPSSGERAQ